MTLADRVAGCLYGAAIGDALGSAFEFVDAATIRRLLREPFVWQYRASVSGSLLHPREPGRPTDDTAMALSVAGAISGGEPLTAALFARRFLTDLNCGTGRFGEMFWSGGPGGATTRALSRLRAGADPVTCGHPEDGGNGAAMRAYPVGFLSDRDEVLRVAALQARVTHGHPAAIAAAQAVAALVHDALAGRAPSLASAGRHRRGDLRRDVAGTASQYRLWRPAAGGAAQYRDERLGLRCGRARDCGRVRRRSGARDRGCRRLGRRYGHCRQHRRRDRWRAERIARAAASLGGRFARPTVGGGGDCGFTTCANRCR